LTAENYQLIKKLLEASGGHFGGADDSELLHRISKISDEVRKMVIDFIKSQKPEVDVKKLHSLMSNDSKRNKAIVFGSSRKVKKDGKEGLEEIEYSILPNLEIITSVEFEPYPEKKGANE
jgi:hypothetical protein